MKRWMIVLGVALTLGVQAMVLAQARHPPANALHTWSGFSTGEWEGDVLVVTTTHVKEAYVRRTG